ncbi:MAG: signal peptidase II [Candidatus Magasanikbacteria bacterium]
MKNKIHLIIYFFISGFFLFLDQVLKYFARNNSEVSFYVWKKYLGWEYFENSGVAFSLPFPNWLIIIVTPIILLGLLYSINKKKRPFGVSSGRAQSIFYLGIFLIFAGAISNFIDRVLFGVTIDYLRVLTGVINLADVMIVVGAGLLVLVSNERKRMNGGL